MRNWETTVGSGYVLCEIYVLVFSLSGMIILKTISEKQNGVLCIRFTWLRIEITGWIL
jgi:hypothetical protein